MFDSKGKIKTREFLRHIEVLVQNSSNRIVDGFQETERELIGKFITNTEDLINHNECSLGLETLLDNICEIEFTLDKKSVELAKDAINACKINYRDWIFIEGLVK